MRRRSVSEATNEVMRSPWGLMKPLDLFRARQRADAFGSDQTCSDLFPVYPQIRNVLKLPMIIFFIKFMQLYYHCKSSKANVMLNCFTTDKIHWNYKSILPLLFSLPLITNTLHLMACLSLLMSPMRHSCPSVQAFKLLLSKTGKFPIRTWFCQASVALQGCIKVIKVSWNQS